MSDPDNNDDQNIVSRAKAIIAVHGAATLSFQVNEDDITHSLDE